MSGPRVALHRGDCREVMLRDMEPGSVNLIDPSIDSCDPVFDKQARVLA